MVLLPGIVETQQGQDISVLFAVFVVTLIKRGNSVVVIFSRRNVPGLTYDTY